MAEYQQLKGHRDLKVYQLAYKLAMEIFQAANHSPGKRNIRLPTKSSALPEVMQPTSPRDFANGNTQKCSQANLLTPTAKPLRLKYGSILPAMRIHAS
jgi:hypothetical protein